ncbi:hypothetical protein BDW42DRAFT_175531 [Aspergillus taichungensis]|uniref:Uncharacterized protein n=1 Tax=Aspergillus taichungensis TaxID=482145 RepID=A0A2J5HLN6_9EURO|nr:hypothetical protein BDW42DRAFT_175531 [Aspergillus taichungensis]
MTPGHPAPGLVPSQSSRPPTESGHRGSTIQRHHSLPDPRSNPPKRSSGPQNGGQALSNPWELIFFLPAGLFPVLFYFYFSHPAEV